jgi:hypothetical protein
MGATRLAHCGFGCVFCCLLDKCILSPAIGYRYSPWPVGRQTKNLPCVLRTGAFLLVPRSPGPSPQWAVAQGGAASLDVYGFDIRHLVFFGFGGLRPLRTLLLFHSLFFMGSSFVVFIA